MCNCRLPSANCLLFGEWLMRVDLVLIKSKRDFLTAKRNILALRIALPVIGHEDALEARVTGEADAEHVVGLALLPVCGSPQAGKCRHSWVVLRRADFQADAVAILMRE